MNDLIWIGNALYPRWIVFGMSGVICVAVIGFAVWMTERDARS